MKLLLDTHIFLWFISGDQKLPIHLQNSIRDLNNDVYLSCVSVWEATVKYQLGKLPLPESPEIYLPKQRQQHLISSLNLDEQSIAQLVNLPLLHRDPFDRILICQALQHDMTIVTVDSAIRAYSVSTLY
ncbi:MULTISPECIES: type II toxin-antitoxin system VapC family toxin [unclassified Nodularia (in: cyanobacteria)]|uniref:type II toxin-antitoxin system VapC family toxin n=1 Tax=unclassified Nodularia (in: cyanobacteria) TaxID=2656917 RepID=UPI001882EAA9|nr:MULTISPECIES: type II toxin-antitoxin system VapC family toxin [unclassified Nodularia (in: cyanobacteria)]MBE9198656.1 type II toxin-antitoxin system VapC family toxin [Nodularia sp. LEGE 06071]MCC2691774.1 type II toxin-antitoxin system VapC family toxin [Nodularia sp. LEGE 04288]